MKCDNCGTEMEKSIDGSTLTWTCPNCGDALARTYIDPIRTDETVYELSIEEGAANSKESIRAVADIAACNYLGAKRMIEAAPTVLLAAKAEDIKCAALQLEGLGLPYSISPTFPYSIKER
ncbi:hypothetical protein [Olsenella phocaeensis]|uniref:hypothetical protein n=1 Tax=Olsenella phocaeensis TaxID=1852385 RepID=UPI003A8E8A5F